MAQLFPSNISEMALSLGETAELRTLSELRKNLSGAYSVFHSVHWSRDGAERIAIGEADFIVVNRAGECVVIEQKSGVLEETSSGLVKKYSDGQKDVSKQIHRTLNGIRDQFKRQAGRPIDLDYLIYCPHHRIIDLNSVGLAATRIVDSTEATRLADRVRAILKPSESTEQGTRVLRFFEDRFHLTPDIHAVIAAGERSMVRLTGVLAETLTAIEMAPFRLRIRGTAGCGKSVIAVRFADRAVAVGRKPLLVCFNRPLAERLKMVVAKGTTVETFYGFMDRFLKARGHNLEYTQISKPGFWAGVQEAVICEEISSEWKFDTLIVDEGQDFESGWADIIQLFLEPGFDALWLEDPDQSIRVREGGAEVTKAAMFVDSFVGFRARFNYRSPETIAKYIATVLPFDFVAANPMVGLGVQVAMYKEPGDQGRRVGSIITELLRTGFKHGDIVVLSMKGLARAVLAQEKRVGAFTLARPTGEYDLLGNQIFEQGQIRFDTVYRFKGQQSPAVILTDVDFGEDRLDHVERLLFSAMTRATMRLEILAQEGCYWSRRLQDGAKSVLDS